MKSHIYFISIFTASTFIYTSCAQKIAPPDASQVLEKVSQALDLHAPFHYRAQARFKEMGGDTFGIRNFYINYKPDTLNEYYGYDWIIAESMDSGYTYSFMTTPQSIYAIFDGNKSIGQADLPKTLDPGSYTYNLCAFLILGEVILPFVNDAPENILVRDSANYYTLSRHTHDLNTYQLTIQKDTWLPVQTIETLPDSSFDLAQITEINFYYDEKLRSLPDTAFSIDHYLSLGYTLHFNNPDSTEKQVDNQLTPESKEFLLKYPFITDKNDTTFIRSVKPGYILLDFWYSSCTPCLRGLPLANQLGVDYADKGLEVIGVNCIDKGISSSMSAKLRAMNISMPLWFGSRDLLESLQMNAFPTYILITPDRQVEVMLGGIDDVKQTVEHIFQNFEAISKEHDGLNIAV